VRVVLPSGTCNEDGPEALCSWRYASPARRSGSWQRVAARVPRQVILLLQHWFVRSVYVIYKAFDDASKVKLLGSLSCGSERIP